MQKNYKNNLSQHNLLLCPSVSFLAGTLKSIKFVRTILCM